MRIHNYLDLLCFEIKASGLSKLLLNDDLILYFFLFFFKQT